MEIFYNSTFVVGISFVLFILLLLYLGVHKLLAAKLDERAAGIRTELDEARKLREDAQELFAEFERKQKEVEGQAEEIIAHARVEAEQAAERAKADIARTSPSVPRSPKSRKSLNVPIVRAAAAKQPD